MQDRMRNQPIIISRSNQNIWLRYNAPEVFHIPYVIGRFGVAYVIVRNRMEKSPKQRIKVLSYEVHFVDARPESNRIRIAKHGRDDEQVIGEIGDLCKRRRQYLAVEQICPG